MTAAITFGAGGLLGWRVLKQSEDRQMEILSKDPGLQRNTAYFRQNIDTALTAEDLVKDYRLLNVALGAFGLEADISNKAFIRQVLDSDVSDRTSLVNRLSDKRYLRLAEALGYGAGASAADELGEKVSAAYLQREFERRVGEGDENLRLALNARRELQGFAGRDSKDSTLWFEVMGNPPLREVFEGAFGFGNAYGKLSIDRQLEEFTKASERYLGSASFADIATDQGIDKLVRNFLARSQLEQVQVQNRYSAALTLLSS